MRTFLKEITGQLSSCYIPVIKAEPYKYTGMEGLYAELTLVFFQDLPYKRAEQIIVALIDLKLYYNRHPAVYNVQSFAKLRDPLIST